MSYPTNLMLLVIFALFLVNCGEESATSTAQKAKDALESNPIELDKRTVEKAKELLLFASEKSFYGIEIQQPLASYTDKLSKTTTENGEGTFEVYEIKNSSGELLAQVYPDPMNEALVGDIVILNDKISTNKGVKIGMTFGELKGKFDDYKVHGSEVESRVHFFHGNHVYRLDHISNEYNLDENEISDDSKVIEMIIRRGVGSSGS